MHFLCERQDLTAFLVLFTRYKGVALESCPEMMYIGMQDQFFTFNMFDAQVRVSPFLFPFGCVYMHDNKP